MFVFVLCLSHFSCHTSLCGWREGGHCSLVPQCRLPYMKLGTPVLDPETRITGPCIDQHVLNWFYERSSQMIYQRYVKWYVKDMLNDMLKDILKMTWLVTRITSQHFSSSLPHSILHLEHFYQIVRLDKFSHLSVVTTAKILLHP